MMTDKIHQIANYYGIEAQLNQLKEECAELIVAASKYNRADKTDVILNADLMALSVKRERYDIVEEISDVTFMIKQVMILLGIDQSEIDEVMKYKINRQLERISRDVLERGDTQ